MSRFRRLSSLLAILLGLVGIVACAAVAVVVWYTASRLNKANANLFDAVDTSLMAVRDRALGAQKRVQESKITTEDIGQSLRNWTREETSQRIATRLKVAEKAERLAVGLRQADQRMETSEVSIQGVEQAFEIANSLGAAVDMESVDPLLAKLSDLRNKLKQSIETVEAIHEKISQMADGEAPEERITQVGKLAVRVVATLGQLDTRLAQLADRLSLAQTNGLHLKNKTRRYVIAAEVCAVLLIVWMAAGQVCLYRYGWNRR